MWQTFQSFLRALVPFQKLFVVAGVSSIFLVAFLLLSHQPEYDRYLPLLIMFMAWNLSLASVTWGIRYTQLERPESGLFNKLIFKLSKAILWVAEFLFLLTSIALLWLSLRALSFYLRSL